MGSTLENGRVNTDREKVAHPAERKQKSVQEPGWSPDKQRQKGSEESWMHDTLHKALRPSKVGLGLVGFCLVQWEERTVPYSLNQVIILIVGLLEKEKFQGNRGAPEGMFRHRNEKPNHQETSKSRVEGLVRSHLSWWRTDTHPRGPVPERAWSCGRQLCGFACEDVRFLRHKGSNNLVSNAVYTSTTSV